MEQEQQLAVAMLQRSSCSGSEAHDAPRDELLPGGQEAVLGKAQVGGAAC